MSKMVKHYTIKFWWVLFGIVCNILFDSNIVSPIKIIFRIKYVNDVFSNELVKN